VKNRLLILLLFSMLIPVPVRAFAEGGQLYILVDAENDISRLTKRDLQEIYLGKRTLWADTSIRIEPVRPSNDSDANREFFSSEKLPKVMGMSLGEFLAHWSRKLFSGDGVPPKVIESESEFLEFIKSHKGAIGFSNSKPNAPGVKTLDLVD